MNSKMTLNLKQEKQNNGTINNIIIIIVRIYSDFNDHAFNLFSENKTRNE